MQSADCLSSCSALWQHSGSQSNAEQSLSWLAVIAGGHVQRQSLVQALSLPGLEPSRPLPLCADSKPFMGGGSSCPASTTSAGGSLPAWTLFFLTYFRVGLTPILLRASSALCITSRNASAAVHTSLTYPEEQPSLRDIGALSSD